MAESSNPPICIPLAIVSQKFCAASLVDLKIKRKLSITEGNFVVTDDNGNVMFKINGEILSLHDRRVLLDNTGNPILTLQRKILSAHSRWKVYRGDSTDADDLLFRVRKSGVIQRNTELDVFFAANTKKVVCDFKIIGSWLESSCTIYRADTSATIAKMHREHIVQSLLGKGTYSVTVYPQVDSAFIVALVVVLAEINEN